MQMQLLKNILGKGRWGFERYGCDHHQMTPAERLALADQETREQERNSIPAQYGRAVGLADAVGLLPCTLPGPIVLLRSIAHPQSGRPGTEPP